MVSVKPHKKGVTLCFCANDSSKHLSPNTLFFCLILCFPFCPAQVGMCEFLLLVFIGSETASCSETHYYTC